MSTGSGENITFGMSIASSQSLKKGLPKGNFKSLGNELANAFTLSTYLSHSNFSGGKLVRISGMMLVLRSLIVGFTASVT